jgi:hypothetical protein
MKKAVPVSQNALYSCFNLFVADLYSVALVKTEVVLPDRNAKLWSGMSHEEYADEAPLLKVVIYPDLHPDL